MSLNEATQFTSVVIEFEEEELKAITQKQPLRAWIPAYSFLKKFRKKKKTWTSTHQTLCLLVEASVNLPETTFHAIMLTSLEQENWLNNFLIDF